MYLYGASSTPVGLGCEEGNNCSAKKTLPAESPKIGRGEQEVKFRFFFGIRGRRMDLISLPTNSGKFLHRDLALPDG